MKNQNNLTATKRIAIIAPADKRKELIEWSYANRDMLASHELLAVAGTANILEGTVNKPVQALARESAGGYEQMAGIMRNKKVDIIFFFENPMRTFRQDDTLRQLLDIALEMNIVIAGMRSGVDFMKASA
jgi:methylglyoxal synthase